MERTVIILCSALIILGIAIGLLISWPFGGDDSFGEFSSPPTEESIAPPTTQESEENTAMPTPQPPVENSTVEFKKLPEENISNISKETLGEHGDLIVIHDSLSYTGEGWGRILGEVYNNGSSRYKDIEVTAYANGTQTPEEYADTGEPFTGDVWIDILEPGDKAPFVIYLRDKSATKGYKEGDLGTYDTEVTGYSKTSDRKYKDYTITYLYSEFSEEAGDEVVGAKIENHGDETIACVRAIMTIYNYKRDYEVEDFKWNWLVESLGPGDSTDFEITIDADEEYFEYPDRSNVILVKYSICPSRYSWPWSK